MGFRFTIPGRLKSYNDVVSANRISGSYGNSVKRAQQEMIAKHIPEGKADVPADVRILWVEPNCRRDHDNVASAVKFILDALVEKGTIPDDSPRYILNISHEFRVSRQAPRIEVELIGAEDERY